MKFWKRKTKDDYTSKVVYDTKHASVIGDQHGIRTKEEADQVLEAWLRDEKISTFYLGKTGGLIGGNSNIKSAEEARQIIKALRGLGSPNG